MEKQMIIQMAIVVGITWTVALIWYRYVYPLRLARKALNEITNALLWLNDRTPWNKLIDKGFKMKAFDAELHPRSKRPKLYMQRYGI